MRSSTIIKGLLYGLVGGLAAYICGNAAVLLGVLTAIGATALAATTFALGFTWAVAEDLEEEKAIETE